MINTHPRVSIIIPTFNRSNRLGNAIQSALNQTYSNLEIIISDNHSTDNTKKIADQYAKYNRVKYFKNSKNMGMVGNWNKCINHRITGEWFLILSDDDILINNNFISEAITTLDDFNNISLIYSNAEIFDEITSTTNQLYFSHYGRITGKNIFMSRGKIYPQDFVLCSVLFNRKIALKLNSFSNKNDISCDSELFLKSCCEGDVLRLNIYSSKYIYHSQNLINNFKKDFELLSTGLDGYNSALSYAIDKAIISPDQIRSWKKQVILPVAVELLKCCIQNFPTSILKFKHRMNRYSSKPTRINFYYAFIMAMLGLGIGWVRKRNGLS